MNTDYSDITSRLGEPLWWDYNAVPRYEPFKPSRCGIYFKQVALLRVGCQGCSAQFKMAIEFGLHQPIDTSGSPSDFAEWFCGVDPPRHGAHGWEECTGTSMTIEPIEVLEFWEPSNKGEEMYQRVPKMEGLVSP